MKLPDWLREGLEFPSGFNLLIFIALMFLLGLNIIHFCVLMGLI